MLNFILFILYIITFEEVELGITADVGQLQRLPKITGNESLLKELCFTGRMFSGDEAFRLGKEITY